MTPDDRFGRTLSTWLHEEAEHRVPDHLAEVLVQTAATRQRPWWSSLERVLPMTTMSTGRALARPPVFWFALLALVALAAVGAVLLAGSLRTAPAPLGLASNGRIVVVDGSTIATYAADGTDRRTLLRVTGADSIPAMSPDGTRVAVKGTSTPPTIRVVTIADRSATELPILEAEVIADEPMSWSPDGKYLTFAGLAAGRDVVFVIAADGSSVDIPTAGLLDPETQVQMPSFSPDGTWIAFAGKDTRTSFGSLYVMRPDGSDIRALEAPGSGTHPSVEIGDGGGPVWAPDPAVHRLAYLTFSGGALVTRVFDVDTNTDHTVGPGFWPSWSPDGARLATCCATIVDIEDVLAGDVHPVTAFEQPGDGSCGDFLDWSGRAICSAVAWSPDGKWLIAGDIAGRDLLLAPVDGSQPPRRIERASGSNIGTFRVPVAWQPVWP
jgi:hypothetical protein